MTARRGNPPTERRRAALADRQDRQWRDPAQVAGQWHDADRVDGRLLEYEAHGGWWRVLEECGITLLVTREYEHLVMAMCVAGGSEHISYMALPHPSGLAVDREKSVVHVASTRNPNQIYDLAPARGLLDRPDVAKTPLNGELVPVRSRYFPGCLYIHDLAFIGSNLHANAVGENAVVRIEEDGSTTRVWWPRCIETDGTPLFGRNHLQLNSIAAGPDLAGSFFSASASRISRWRPGHLKFPVDGTGVIFSGETREPAVSGLTRPHSARLNRGALWVDNSGYGEVGFADGGAFRPVARLPGWTRGLCFHGDIVFVGTSRVIPRFRCYAPGLDVGSSVCGVHALDRTSGEILGSLTWPWGNQIFAIDWLSREQSAGFPRVLGRERPARIKRLFYAFSTAADS